MRERQCDGKWATSNFDNEFLVIGWGSNSGKTEVAAAQNQHEIPWPDPAQHAAAIAWIGGWHNNNDNVNAHNAI